MSKKIIILVKILGWVTLFWNIFCLFAFLFVSLGNGGQIHFETYAINSLFALYFVFLMICSIGLIKAKNWGRLPLVIASVITVVVPFVVILLTIPEHLENARRIGKLISAELQVESIIYVIISIVPIITIWFLTRKNVKEALKNTAELQATVIQS